MQPKECESTKKVGRAKLAAYRSPREACIYQLRVQPRETHQSGSSVVLTKLVYIRQICEQPRGRAVLKRTSEERFDLILSFVPCNVLGRPRLVFEPREISKIFKVWKNWAGLATAAGRSKSCKGVTAIPKVAAQFHINAQGKHLLSEKLVVQV